MTNPVEGTAPVKDDAWLVAALNEMSRAGRDPTFDPRLLQSKCVEISEYLVSLKGVPVGAWDVLDQDLQISALIGIVNILMAVCAEKAKGKR